MLRVRFHESQLSSSNAPSSLSEEYPSVRLEGKTREQSESLFQDPLGKRVTSPPRVEIEPMEDIVDGLRCLFSLTSLIQAKSLGEKNAIADFGGDSQPTSVDAQLDSLHPLLSELCCDDESSVFFRRILARICRILSSDAEMISTLGKSQSCEYSAQASVLSEYLSEIGIPVPTFLSNRGRSRWRNIASLSSQLDVLRPSSETLVCAVSELLDGIDSDHGIFTTLLEQENYLVRSIQELDAVLVSFSRQNSRLSEEEAEKVAVLNTQKENSQFLRSKSEQYEQQKAGLTRDLRAAGFDPRTTHGALLQLCDELYREEIEKQHILEELATFEGLSTDVDLARVEVAQARQELRRLTDALDEAVAEANFGVE